MASSAEITVPFGAGARPGRGSRATFPLRARLPPGGYTGLHPLGHFDRLTLACRIFGRRLVEEEIGRVRRLLTDWGYQYGQEHDKGVPSVMSQAPSATTPRQLLPTTEVRRVNKPQA